MTETTAAPRRQRGWRRLASAAFATFVVAAGLVSSPAHAAGAPEADATIRSAPANAGLLADDVPLEVSVRISNSGDAPTPAGTATLAISAQPLSEEGAIANWSDGIARPAPQMRQLAEAEVAEIAAGDTREFTLAVTEDDDAQIDADTDADQLPSAPDGSADTESTDEPASTDSRAADNEGDASGDAGLAGVEPNSEADAADASADATGADAPPRLDTPSAPAAFVRDLESGTYALEVAFDGRISAGIVTVLDTDAADSAAVSLVAPVVAGQTEEGLLPVDTLRSLTGGAGALRGLVDAAPAGTTFGVDPAIVAAIRARGSGAGSAANTWLALLEDTAFRRFALQFGDADLATQAAAGLDAPLQPLGLGEALPEAELDDASAEQAADDADADTADADEASGGEVSGDETVDEADASASQSADATDSAGSDAAARSDDATGTAAGAAASAEDAASADDATAAADSDAADGAQTQAEPTPADVAPEAPVTLESLTDVRPTVDGLLWPASGTATEQVLAYAGDGTTLVASEQVQQQLTGSHVTIGEHDALVYDSEVAEALLVAATDEDPIVADRAAARAVALAQQRIQRADGAPVVLALERGQITDSGRLTQVLDAVQRIAGGSFRSLATQTAHEAAPADLIEPRRPDADRGERLRTMLDDETAVTGFAVVLDQPELLIGRERARTLQALGVAWRASEFDWRRHVEARHEGVKDILNAVSIRLPDTITLVSKGSTIPVFVVNNLPYAVSVDLRAQPTDLRITVAESTPVHIPASTTQQTGVAVTSGISSGDAQIDMHLLAMDGNTRIGDTRTAELTVRADWERIGLIILSLLVALLVGFGVVRTVLRRRRAVADEAAADAADTEPRSRADERAAFRGRAHSDSTQTRDASEKETRG